MTVPIASDPVVRIAGGGPAGLAAALTLARQGRRVCVYERRAAVGARFHGDLQGLENWTTGGDVLEELADFGICPDFAPAQIREFVLFDPDGRSHICRDADPLFYLVERGSGPGSLDTALRRQAEAAGVEIRWSTPAPADADIIATGPRRADVIAVGYIFQTDMADGVYAAVSDELAPQGYAYLLVSRGRGTLATCLFADFAGREQYLERSRRFFERHMGLRMRDPHRFGGVGCFGPFPVAGAVPLVGEAGGYQDALFGFGMRYAMRSGHLAAQALIDGHRDERRQRVLLAQMRTGAANRYLYARFGEWAYRYLIWRVTAARSPRRWLRGFYGPSLLKRACLSRFQGPLEATQTAHEFP